MSAPSTSQPPYDLAATLARDAYFSDAILSAAEFPTAELAPPVREQPTAPGGNDTRRAFLDQSARLATLLHLWSVEEDGPDGLASAFPTAAELFLDIDPALLSHDRDETPEARRVERHDDEGAGSIDDDYVALIAQQLFGTAPAGAAA